MRRGICSVCGRSVACQGSGLRQHKSVSAWDLAVARRRALGRNLRGVQPSPAEYAQQRASTYCIGGAQQMALPF